MHSGFELIIKAGDVTCAGLLNVEVGLCEVCWTYSGLA
jgi:hypothetical protein